MSKLIREEVLTLARYSAPAEPSRHLIKLDQNESPDDLPQELRRAALARIAVESFNRYPSVTPEGLRHRLARLHDWPFEGVAVANGSNVLIQALTAAAGIGRTVVVSTPSFSLYGLSGRLLARDLIEVPLTAGFALDLAGLDAALERSRGGLLFIANPDAPTGVLHDEDEVRALARRHPATLLVVDEAYAPFAGNGLPPTLASLPNAVVLRTFSKAYGLAGLRIGYALGSPVLIEQLHKVLLPFCVDRLAQIVAEVALDHPAHLEARVTLLNSERERVLARLAGLHALQALPSVANFFLLRTPDAATTHRAFVEQGVLLRRVDHQPGLAGHLRVSIGAPAENDAFIAAATRVDHALAGPARAS